MDEIIYKNNNLVSQFFQKLEKMQDKIEHIANSHRTTLNGEHYLSDKELAERLRISRRTLQDYRNEGRIPYYQLGGKILYRESEIQALLEKKHTKSYK